LKPVGEEGHRVRIKNILVQRKKCKSQCGYKVIKCDHIVEWKTDLVQRK
jgi:hypothetical protein